MMADAYLAREGYVLTDARAAGNAYLSREDTVFPNNDVVRHLNKIIDFYPSTDKGPAKRRPVHGRICANLDVIFHFDDPDLGNLDALAAVAA
jgi:hypothetical protein